MQENALLTYTKMQDIFKAFSDVVSLCIINRTRILLQRGELVLLEG
jgi:hypothetical protein